MVISPLEVKNELSRRELAIVEEVDIKQLLREALIDSRSFSVVMREQQPLQTLFKERDLEDSPMARKASPQGIGLDVASYVLVPSITTFDLSTRYTALDLLPNYFERHDRFALDMAILVVDAGGNVVFEERIQRKKSFTPTEADAEEKRKNPPRHMSYVRSEIKNATRDAVDALVARINPITVIDVQGAVIIIDRGRNNGFDKASYVEVYSKSKIIEHPTTGESIQIPGRQIGKGQITKLHDSFAEVELVSGKTEEVLPGSLVYLIKGRPKE